MTESLSFKLRDDYIELYKLLKAEGMASSGAEAKYFVAEGLVKVNGETELRKRKKLIPGDTVHFSDIEIKVEM
jgi:ribosome-associated protein